jgi:hypothetical protein
MIDDDELPIPQWLASLYRCALSLNADAVFGPVEPVYPAACPQWMVDGRYFERRRFPTGTAIQRGGTRTGNVLFRRMMISDRKEPFDPAFGLSGGSDSLLFDGLLLEGKRFYWCDEAVVEEDVPEERATWQWLLQRSFRGGQGHGRMVLSGFGKVRPPITLRLLFFVRTIVLFSAAVVMFLGSLPFGKRRWFKWLCSMSTQAGKAAAFTPFVYREYGKPT